jgi:NCAIR mutase (PurE)-related protein
MDDERVVKLLEQVRSGQLTVSTAVARLRHLPFEDLGFAKVDHHRALRQGFPEVIMGQGKRARDIAAIVRAMRRNNNNILVTRIDPAKMAELKRLRTGLKFHPTAGAANWQIGSANR